MGMLYTVSLLVTRVMPMIGQLYTVFLQLYTPRRKQMHTNGQNLSTTHVILCFTDQHICCHMLMSTIPMTQFGAWAHQLINIHVALQQPSP